MFPVKNPISEPPTFREKAFIPGQEWLAANSTGRPPDRWSDFREDLAKAFEHRCGYLAMRDMNGTVDHFTSVDEDRTLSYTWDNYRYIAGWLNSTKQAIRSDLILDPFEVQSGWFSIQWPTLYLLGTGVPSDVRLRASNTLDKLDLIKGRRAMRQRETWLREYFQGLPLTFLGVYAPLLAEMVVREGVVPPPREAGAKP